MGDARAHRRHRVRNNLQSASVPSLSLSRGPRSLLLSTPLLTKARKRKTAYIASRIFLAERDLDAGAAAIIALQTLGGALGTITAQSIYQSLFQQYISRVPGLDVEQILASGLTEFRKTVAPELLPAAVGAATKVHHCTCALLRHKILTTLPSE